VAPPSIASLIKDYVSAFKRWTQDVAALGKIEMSDQGKKAGAGAGLIAGAAFFAFFAFALLTWALGYGLVQLGLQVWAAFLIVGVFYLLIAGIMALVARRLLSGLTGPERTIAAIKAGPGIPLGGSEETTPAP
jgi:fatty acid desaturase